MQTKRDWDIHFDAAQYVAQAGGTLSGLLDRPRVKAEWEAALADAAGLVEPAATWDTFPIREVRHERLVLANGTTVGGGPLTSVVAGARELAVAVCTAGSAISCRISEHQRNGQRLRAVFLDDLASWAVDQVRQQLCRTIEAEAAARGWQASASLSPGESAWPVSEQSVIFSLLDTRPIGVVLSESLVWRKVSQDERKTRHSNRRYERRGGPADGSHPARRRRGPAGHSGRSDRGDGHRGETLR